MPTPRLQRHRKVLILTPRHWSVEECCVQDNSSTTPSGALMLAALLRKNGHLPQVLNHHSGATIQVDFTPDVVVFYAPFNVFLAMMAPIITSLRQALPDACFILVMYDSLADSEEQAMRSCFELDYAVLPHEKELSILDLVNHGARRCPGTFDRGLGVIYRDQNNQLASSGPRKALPNLDHLPYLGDELAIYWRENDCRPYNAAAITFQRGCPNPCTFCPMRGTRPRYRNPEIVAREMKVATELTGGSYLLSLEVLHEPRQVHALCDLLLAKDIRLSSGLGARCEYVQDQDLIEKLARAGLKYLYFGVEAATEEMRARLRKPTSDEAVRQAVDATSRAGLGFICSFLTGLPWEDEAYYRDLTMMILDLGQQPHCQRINLARLMPWPGLPITGELVEHGIIDREFSFEEWNLANGPLLPRFRRTKHLSTRQLEEAYALLFSLTEELSKRHKTAAPVKGK